jgi:hypothetical protein
VKLLVALFVLAVFLVGAAPTIVARTTLRNRLASQAAAGLNGSIEVGGASLGWFSPIELRDVTIADAQGRPVARVARVTSSRSLLGLLRDRTALGEITLVQPTLEVVCADGSSNLEEVLRKYFDEETPSGTTRTEMTIRVEKGTLVLRDAMTGNAGEFHDLGGSVSIPAARTEPIGAKLFANAPGRLEVDLAAGESGRLKLVSNGVALESLAPLMRRFSVELTPAGLVSADLTASWQKSAAEVEGTISCRNLAVSGAVLAGETLRLGTVEIPIKGTIAGRVIHVERAQLSSDLGSIGIAGMVDTDEPIEKVLERPGMRLVAEVDLARLARTLPKTLRVRDRTVIREGKLVARVESRAGSGGIEWLGKIETSALRAERDGKEVKWDEPVAIEFAGRYRPGKLPEFDKLICRSDFIALQAEVKPDSIRAAANIHLDRLTARLADFVDLGGATFDGQGGATLVAQRDPDGSFKAEASLDLKQFAFTNVSGRGMREEGLSIRISAAGLALDGGPIAVSKGTAALTAGADELKLALVEPIEDAKRLASGAVDARLTGDLGRWWKRVGAFVQVPKHYVLGGMATAKGIVRFSSDTIAAERLSLHLANARFRGAGLDLEEPQMEATANVLVDTKTATATFDKFSINSAPLSVTNGRLVIRTPPRGEVVVEGSGPVVAGFGRLGKTLKLFVDPRGPNSMHGRGAGQVRFRSSGDVTTFGGTLDVTSFSIGQPASPDWTEPALRVETEGSYTESSDTLSLSTARLERPGLAMTAAVTIEKLAGAANLEANGTLTYDLAKLSPKLREELGGGFTAKGSGTAPISLSGSLLPPSAPGSPPRSGAFSALNGEFRIGWDVLRAYGFEMGKSELHGKLARGVGRVNPLSAKFGGGTVNIHPTVHLEVEPGYFVLEKGRIVDRARLTPAVCAEAVGYALPAIARSAKAEGEMSITLGENRISFSDSTKALVKGQITIHKANVAPGPVASEIAKLLGVGNLTMTVSRDTVVSVRIENGAVHHHNFAVQIGGHTISTSGSVGFDGKLNLMADVPIPSALLKNSPLASKALANRRVKLPITGTLSQPVLDPRQLQASISRLAQDAMKDLGRDILNKELERIFPGMPSPKR